MPRNVHDPERSLGAAVILHAMREAKRGDDNAATWLITDGPIWLDGLGLGHIKPQQIAARVDDPKPLTMKAHRPAQDGGK